MKPNQSASARAISRLAPNVETPEPMTERNLESVRSKPFSPLGTTDICKCFFFCDDPSTSRDPAFAKIGTRVARTTLAWDELGETR
jgi:5-methyltetrahydropteroyltriglutamate--homocysteine methyltransferase